VAAYSPRLDSHGSSVRGSAIVQTLSERFGMHLLEPHESISEPAVRVERTPSGRIIRIGGELGLAGAERLLAVLRDFAESAPDGAEVLVDTSGIARSHPHAIGVLEAALAALPPSIRFTDEPGR